MLTMAMLTDCLKGISQLSSIRARQKMNIAAAFFLTANGVSGVVSNQRRVGCAVE
jgi:hypothetical protein